MIPHLLQLSLNIKNFPPLFVALKVSIILRALFYIPVPPQTSFIKAAIHKKRVNAFGLAFYGRSFIMSGWIGGQSL